MSQINREAAIEAFWKLDVEIRPSVIDAIIKMLKQLPPAQPEIVRCKDCKHYTFEPGPNSVNCYVQHCTRSVRVSTGPDEFCSRAERR